jgi:hypothetical protein
MARVTKRATPAPGVPTQAEVAYGTGQRHMPPLPEEMSPESHHVMATGFGQSLSNLKTREQGAINKGLAGALTQGTVNRLTDTEVTVDTAARNLAGHWKTMMGAPDRPEPAWYFGHNRRLTSAANEFGVDPNRAIAGSGSMSPQNDPDSEYRAARSMMDAHTNRRQITATSDIYSGVSETEQKKGVKPRLVMRAGERRQLSTMHPDDMQHVTSTSNRDKITHAGDFDLPGFRSAGTNRRQGFETLRPGGEYNAVDEMKAAKVHLYTSAIREAKPDTPLHHEYEMRFGDQEAARNVRMGRAADKRKGITGSESIRGVPDRVDIYGLMKGGSDPTDPAYKHPVLGTLGHAVPDTWMNALLSGQDITDAPGAPSPAKMAGSQTQATSAGIGTTPEGVSHTFMGKKEAQEAGGKEWTGNAAFGMGSLAAMRQAATYGREAESQTNIPPVMMQEMTWVHGRLRVASSVEENLKNPDVDRGTAMNRIRKLRGGSLAGEKEFRPSTDTGPAPVSKIEPPGMFSRGYDNPLTRGEGITVVPAGEHAAAGAGSGTRKSRRDISATNFNVADSNPLREPKQRYAASTDPENLSKRRAIRGAQAGYKASRADGGAAWHEEKAPRRLSEGF